MDSSEIEHLQELVATHQAALRILEKQKAVHWMLPPVHVQLEISTRENEVKRLNSRIQLLQRLASLESRLEKDDFSKGDLEDALKGMADADQSAFESITALSEMNVFFARYMAFLARGITLVGIGVGIVLFFALANLFGIQSLTAQLSGDAWEITYRVLGLIAVGVASAFTVLFVLRTRTLAHYWNEMRETDFAGMEDAHKE